MISPGALLRERRIVVCVGTGGVGKTTVAASLALRAARDGRRALVLTIDPARRLADALGVEAIGNRPTELRSDRRAALGIPDDGALFALMLDMKSTFDDLVERFAEDEESRRRILDNQIYQHVSDALAGSAEYAAMEKVYELAESGDFDLVVVDTPPSQHALDFLDAPQRLLEFLDSRIVQMLLHPAFAAGRMGFRIFQRTASRALQLIERVSGVSFLEEVSEFLLAFEGMSEGFRERAERVRSLLLGPDAGFVLVAGPSAESARSAVAFLDHLEETGVPVAGLVVNRMRLVAARQRGRAAARPRAGRRARGGHGEARSGAGDTALRSGAGGGRRACGGRRCQGLRFARAPRPAQHRAAAAARRRGRTLLSPRARVRARRARPRGARPRRRIPVR